MSEFVGDRDGVQHDGLHQVGARLHRDEPILPPSQVEHREPVLGVDLPHPVADVAGSPEASSREPVDI